MTATVHYAIHELVPYVNWIYFFHAWGMQPRFATVSAVHDCVGCRTAWVNSFQEGEQAQAREAEKLYCDALAMLKALEGQYVVGARFGLFPAWSEGDDIIILNDSLQEGRAEEVTMRFPLLRQQRVAKPDSPYLCLADFVSPQKPVQNNIKALPVANVLGVFATAVDAAMENLYAEDDYRHMLVQTLCDRLAEAAAEKIHEDVRRHYWGYAPDESLTTQELFAEKYQGRRPAVGYPSLPDQSFIFLLDKAVDFGKIGISLTENGMMQPHAAVAGLMFGHPAAQHFSVGPIDEVQLNDYAKRRGESPEFMRRFLAANLRLSEV